MTEVDDPRLRLELAKLYEHHEKAYDRAMDLVDRGTSERGEATARRRARLERKRNRMEEGKQRRGSRRKKAVVGQGWLPSLDEDASKRASGGEE